VKGEKDANITKVEGRDEGKGMRNVSVKPVSQKESGPMRPFVHTGRRSFTDARGAYKKT
jgi:hypothetical protein